MALQKLPMLSYEQRLPSASWRASWTIISSRAIGSERHSQLPVHACRYGPGTVRVAASERPAERLFVARMTRDNRSDHAESIGSDTVLRAVAQEPVGSNVHDLR